MLPNDDEEVFNINDNIAICINSLCKLDKIDEKQLKNICLYIDEISSFLLLTHNSTLDPIIKKVFTLLIQFITKSKKLICTDAMINEQVMEIIKLRKNKKIYIENKFINYNGINALKINDDELLINKLIKKIKNKQYFIFASDSATIATKYYELCFNNSDIKDDLIIITKNHNFDLMYVNTIM